MFPDLPKIVVGSVTTYTKELNTLKVTAEIMLIFKIYKYTYTLYIMITCFTIQSLSVSEGLRDVTPT